MRAKADPVAAFIQLQVCPMRLGMSATQYRLDPCNQLPWAIRLTQIVVSAKFQPEQTVNFFHPGGSNYDGHIGGFAQFAARSEEHTSELQSRGHLVCRLLLEKKHNTE